MIPEDFPALDLAAVNAFITCWSAATGSERANYQLFLEFAGQPAQAGIHRG
ncbi:MAG: hypothetical protein WAW42_11695 [Candidatus Competibacteraceae bacterium]